VIAELAIALREDVTLDGELVFAGMFTLVWWSWVSSTLYANRFHHDDVVYRLYKLGSMAAVIGLAASATEATAERFGVFVGCQLLLRAMLLLQYRRAYRHVPAARPIVRLYLVRARMGALLWALTDTGMARGLRRGWWWPLAAAVIAALDAVLQLPAVAVAAGLAALLTALVVVGTAERSTGRVNVDPV
jgi:low temperature requirement protein LtrA